MATGFDYNSSEFPRQTKFDYENSINRRNYLSRKKFRGLFWYLTCVNIILLFLCFYLLFTFVRGWQQIILAVALFLESYGLARRYSFRRGGGENPADNLPIDILELLEKTIFEAKKEGIAEITPEYLFMKLPSVFSGRLIFNRLMIPSVEFPKTATNPKPVLSASLSELLGQFVAGKKDDLSSEALAIYLYQKLPKIQSLLKEQQVGEKDFTLVASWVKEVELSLHKKKFYENEVILAGVGQEWSYGYTPVLSQFSTDLSQYFADPNLEINTFAHKNIISQMETILEKSGQNNVLLVGDPGVGKKTAVNALANKLAKGDCLASLKYKRVRQLDTGQLLAGARQGELEARLQQSLSEAISAGNLILYIDNFESLIGGFKADENAVGSVDATGIILPFLQNSSLQFIAALSPDDYFNKLRANSSLVDAFAKIDVNPPSKEDSVGILLESLTLVEYKYNVYFPLITLKKIVELSDRYIHDVPFPEKALRLLNEAAVNFNSPELKMVMPDKIEKLVSLNTNIPVGEAEGGEKDKLLNLESFLHQRVVGQNDAITAISDAMRRVRTGLTTGKRPVGVFLFLGPTGVGKTETAKALAENYFGSEKKMIRLDMSEYQEANSIDRLVGTVNDPHGILTDAISKDPFSLILLDELEKADKNVLNIFLQVFEDGRLTDPRGKVSDFTNAIIIATSNAGSEMIREKVQSGEVANLSALLIEDLQQKGIFTPEFINRFDSVVVYKPLSQVELQQIAQMMINSLNKTLEAKQIKIEVAPEALAKLVQLGYDPQFGARPMRRVIQQKVENLLAKKMLSGEAGEGMTIQIGLNDIL